MCPRLQKVQKLPALRSKAKVRNRAQKTAKERKRAQKRREAFKIEPSPRAYYKSPSLKQSGLETHKLRVAPVRFGFGLGVERFERFP